MLDFTITKFDGCILELLTSTEIITIEGTLTRKLRPNIEGVAKAIELITGKAPQGDEVLRVTIEEE